MSSQVARKTILDSIHSLRRRRTILPLSDVTNRFTDYSQPVRTTTKSLIQGQKVQGANGNVNATSIGRIPALARPTLSHGPHSQSFGVRKNYVATKSNYGDFAEEDVRVLKAIADNACIPEVEPVQSDLVVVLDLDECLVHSQFLSAGPEIYRQDEERPQSHVFRSEEEAESIVTSACESFNFPLPDGDLVHVNKRPNLDKFLKNVTRKYETHIFTAAMEVYAAPLLDRLDPKNEMFQKRYFREDCTYDRSLGVYVKDLRRAMQQHADEEFNEKRVVLIDNNPMSFLANPMNGILVCNFYDDAKDDTLQAVMDLLHELDQQDDVRPFLNNKFGLKDALKEAVSAPSSTTWK